MKDLRIFKLKTGEELIGELVSSVTSTTVAIKNVVAIVVVPAQMGGKQQLAFVPYVQFSDDEIINIKEDHVACICAPLQQITDAYHQRFSSLTLPTKSLILPE